MPRSTITPGDGDPRHGTVNGYNTLRCKCPECTAAAAARMARRRAAIAGTLPDRDRRHGTVNGYDNYSCRCDPCRAAHAASVRGRSRPVVATTEEIP